MSDSLSVTAVAGTGNPSAVGGVIQTAGTAGTNISGGTITTGNGIVVGGGGITTANGTTVGGGSVATPDASTLTPIAANMIQPRQNTYGSTGHNPNASLCKLQQNLFNVNQGSQATAAARQAFLQQYLKRLSYGRTSLTNGLATSYPALPPGSVTGVLNPLFMVNRDLNLHPLIMVNR